jgi:hypothetical protein
LLPWRRSNFKHLSGAAGLARRLLLYEINAAEAGSTLTALTRVIRSGGHLFLNPLLERLRFKSARLFIDFD